MTEREVTDRVERIIRDCLGLDPEEDIMGGSLVNDLAADELDVVEITLGIEEEFEAYNLELDEDIIGNMGAVRGIVIYVCEQLGIE